MVKYAGRILWAELGDCVFHLKLHTIKIPDVHRDKRKIEGMKETNLKQKSLNRSSRSGS